MSVRPSLLRRLGRDRRGAGIVEFALAAPLLFVLIVGIAQLGILFFASAGLQSALAEGARFATVYPLHTNDEIQAVMRQKRFGVDPTLLVGPTIVHTPDANNDGVPDSGAAPPTYADITIGYRVPLDFIFFRTEAITLSYSRRVYTQPEV